jgi:hypothetical protein
MGKHGKCFKTFIRRRAVPPIAKPLLLVAPFRSDDLACGRLGQGATQEPAPHGLRSSPPLRAKYLSSRSLLAHIDERSQRHDWENEVSAKGQPVAIAPVRPIGIPRWRGVKHCKYFGGGEEHENDEDP